MQIALVIDALLRIHKAGPAMDAAFGRSDLQGASLHELLDEESCQRISAWWQESPFSPLRLFVKPASSKTDSEPALSLLISPLISTHGSVDFATIEIPHRSPAPAADRPSDSGDEAGTPDIWDAFVRSTPDDNHYSRAAAALYLLTRESGLHAALITCGEPGPSVVCHAGRAPGLNDELCSKLLSLATEEENGNTPDPADEMFIRLPDTLELWPRGDEIGEDYIVPVQDDRQPPTGLLALRATSPHQDLIDLIQRLMPVFSSALLHSPVAGDVPGSAKSGSLIIDIVQMLGSTLDQDEILQSIAQRVHESLQCRAVAFYMIENEKLALKAGAGRSTPLTIDMEHGPAGQAAYAAKTVYKKGATDSSFECEASEGVLAVPIQSEARVEGEDTQGVIGVLVAVGESEQFDSSRMQLLEAVAMLASIAAENIRLLQQVITLLRSEASQRRELEAKKAELDEFIRTISHDLRNPLNNISGFIELLELEMEGDENKKAATYLHRIDANARVISRMIGDLLELSRVGRMEDEEENIDFEGFIREIKYDFTMRHAAEGLELNCFNLPATVRGTRRRLAQLFTNLIGNAVKYAHPERQPRVSITCVDKGDYWQFSISDNGIGIPESKWESIFTFGVRVREKDVEGTGAGLAIARKIVESHGGTIWLDSEPGEGSTFHFTIKKTQHRVDTSV